jgi:Putative polyhydroxyalkanoic acid system protein (PHA_gran_rgn)
MGMIKFEFPHALATDEAKKRVEALLAYWSRKYGVKASWSGEKATMNGKAMGFSFDGWLVVDGKRVGGEASDPGMLLRGQASKYLTRKLGEYLDGKRQLSEILGSED